MAPLAPHVEANGIRFYAAPEYQVFPTRERPAEALRGGRARGRTRRGPPIADFRPDVVVNDVLTLAPALAAELEGVPLATLVPHFYPPTPPGLPPYGLGAMPGRGRTGGRCGGRSRGPPTSASSAGAGS